MDSAGSSKEMAVGVRKSEKEGKGTVKVTEMIKDVHHLATLGYKQVLTRSFGLFENWAATFVCR